jgi:hypothetical protein
MVDEYPVRNIGEVLKCDVSIKNFSLRNGPRRNENLKPPNIDIDWSPTI